MIWRTSILMAFVDLAATASLWYYLAQVGIREPFLYALSAAWIVSICALSVLLVYVATEVNGRSIPSVRRRRA